MKKVLIILAICGVLGREAGAITGGGITNINVGVTANDGTGDPLRSAMLKINANFAYEDSAKANSNYLTGWNAYLAGSNVVSGLCVWSPWNGAVRFGAGTNTSSVLWNFSDQNYGMSLTVPGMVQANTMTVGNQSLTGPSMSALMTLVHGTNVVIPTVTNSMPGLGSVPWMGVNSWWTTCTPDGKGVSLNSAWVTNMVWQFKTNGLLAAGYNLICLDDGWQGYARDSYGKITANPTNFPDMTGLTAWVHSMGFYFGLYTSGGLGRCSTNGNLASWGFESLDAQRFAQWDIDYLKVDECSMPGSYSMEGFDTTWCACLSETNVSVPIVLEMTQEGLWGIGPRYMNAWQCGGSSIDPSSLYITDWVSFTNGVYVMLQGEWNLAGIPQRVSDVSPGHFKDAVVTSVSCPTNTALASLVINHAMFCNPLLIDSNPAPVNMPVFTNANIIRIMQDEACRMAVPAATNGDVVTFKKSLGRAGLEVAFACLNYSPNAETVVVHSKDLGITGDLVYWDAVNNAPLSGNGLGLVLTVPGHAVRLCTVTAGVPQTPVAQSLASTIGPTLSMSWIQTTGLYGGFQIQAKSGSQPNRNIQLESWSPGQFDIIDTGFTDTNSQVPVLLGYTNGNNGSFRIGPGGGFSTMPQFGPYQFIGDFSQASINALAGYVKLTPWNWACTFDAQYPLNAWFTFTNSLAVKNYGWFGSFGSGAAYVLQNRDNSSWTFTTIATNGHYVLIDSINNTLWQQYANGAGAPVFAVDPTVKPFGIIGSAAAPVQVNGTNGIFHGGTAFDTLSATNLHVTSLSTMDCPLNCNQPMACASTLTATAMGTNGALRFNWAGAGYGRFYGSQSDSSIYVDSSSGQPANLIASGNIVGVHGGSGANLTNVPASAITGGYTGNLTVPTNGTYTATLHITNGLVMAVTAP